MGCGTSCTRKALAYAPGSDSKKAQQVEQRRPQTPGEEAPPRRPARPSAAGIYRRTPRLPDAEYRHLLSWLDPARQEVSQAAAASTDADELLGPLPPAVPTAAEEAHLRAAQRAEDEERRASHAAAHERVRQAEAAVRTEATEALRLEAARLAQEERDALSARIAAEQEATRLAAEEAERGEREGEVAREAAVRRALSLLASVSLSEPIVEQLVDERLLRGGLVRWLVTTMCGGEEWRTAAGLDPLPVWQGNSRHGHSPVVLPRGIQARYKARRTGRQRRLEEVQQEEDRERERQREALRRQGREDREAEASEDQARNAERDAASQSRQRAEDERLFFACWALGQLCHRAAQLQREAADPRLHEGLLFEGVAVALGSCLSRWEHCPDDSGAYPWAAVEQAGWAAGNLAIGSHRAQAALVEAGAVQPLISAVNATLASLDLLAQPPTPEAAAAAPVSHVHHGPEAWHRRDLKTATTGVGVEQVDLGLSPAGAAFGGAKKGRLRARLQRLGWSISVLCRAVNHVERTCIVGTAASSFLRLAVLDYPKAQPSTPRAEEVHAEHKLAPAAAPSELSSAVCFAIAELAHADDSTTNPSADANQPARSLGGGAAVLASVSAGAPEQASMRVMRRLYRLLLLSLHEHRQDEREREEASQPGEGEGEKAVLGYAAVRALSNLVQGGGIPPGELLQTGVDALCRRASPPPPAALVARASGSEAEEVTRWEGASRKLCVRALSNLASTTAEQAQEHARSKGLEREPPTIAPRRKPPKSGWVLQKETGKVVFRKEEQVRVRETAGTRSSVMQALIPSAQDAAEQRRKKRSKAAARGLAALKKGGRLLGGLGAAKSRAQVRTSPQKMAEAKLQAEREAAEEKERIGLEGRNVLELLSALGKEVEAGTVDWELVEEGVWLSWNMVAAATALEHVDEDSIEATPDVAQCAYDLPMARTLRTLADEVSIAREELRRRLRSGLMSAAQHGEAMARLEQWNAARRSTVQDDAYVATTAQTGISLLMRGCCVQEARNAAVQRLAHPSDRQRPR